MNRIAVPARVPWLLAGLGIFAALAFRPAPHVGGPQKSADSGVFIIDVAGNFQGSLAPCGCSYPMEGGISRIGAVFNRDRSQGPGLRILAPSTSSSPNGLEPAQVAQSAMKVETVAQIAQALDALEVVSENEKAYGPDVAAEMQILDPKVLDPNGANHKRQIKGWRVWAVDSHTPSSESSSSSEIESIAKAGARVVVVLEGDLSDARRFAELAPHANLIIYQSGGSPTSSPTMVGHTALVSPGDRGRAMVRLAYRGGHMETYSVVALPPTISDDPTVAKLYKGYLKRVDSAALLDHLDRPLTLKYAGSGACLKCHADAYNVWLHSAHARALGALVKVGHARDPDCVGCHVTGLKSQFGFRSIGATLALAKVTCESCHGPGLDHVANPKMYVLTSGKESCVGCHTTDNSPRFQYALYWSKIKHH